MSTPTAVLDDQATPTSTRWAGAIGIEGEPTGDGRLINHGALRWDILPVPLRFVSADVGYHDGAVVVGNIETIERRDGGVLWATGQFDTSEQAAEASRLVGSHMMNGVSMDLDDVSFEVRVAQELVDGDDEEGGFLMLAQQTDDPADDDGRVVVAQIKSDDEVMVTTDGRVRAATLVAVPAFARANIYLDDDPVLAGITAADALPVEDAPPVEGETPAEGGDAQALWDEAVAALTAVDQLEFLSPEYLAATDAAGDAFAAAAIALQSSDPAKAAEAAEIAAKLKRFASLPWGDPADVQVRDSGPTADDTEAPVQEIVAAAAPLYPPEEWFADPQLDGPTPLVVTKEGRVYGHLATWDVCHVASPGGPGICITAPHSNRDYADFHTGTVLTAEDTLIGSGKITMGTGHAPHKLSATATAAHYDNTGTVVADIRAGEDMFGIWVAGALTPGTTEEQARTLRSCPLSGDWREVAGSLELKAALAVPVPGFPIPRPAGKLVASGERLYALTASGILAHDEAPKPTPSGAQLSEADVDYLHRIIQRNRVKDAAELAADVRSIRNRREVAAFATTRRKG
jgi:hypothetical protein